VAWLSATRSSGLGVDLGDLLKETQDPWWRCRGRQASTILSVVTSRAANTGLVNANSRVIINGVSLVELQSQA
jgi:hypothetical protein